MMFVAVDVHELTHFPAHLGIYFSTFSASSKQKPPWSRGYEIDQATTWEMSRN